MLEKRNRNLCRVQDETVAECCCEPLKQKSGKSTLATLEPRLSKREDGIHLRDLVGSPRRSVIETPPNVLAFLDDFWFHYIVDIGNAGPDKGAGSKFLLVPPVRSSRGLFHSLLAHLWCLVCRSRVQGQR
jgi:hypothetical protein